MRRRRFSRGRSRVRRGRRGRRRSFGRSTRGIRVGYRM